MSLTQSPRREPPAPVDAGEAEDRVLLRGVGLALYEAIDASRGDHSVPRLTWIDEELELMSPSQRHEGIARVLTQFVLLVAEALGLDPLDLGSTTWRRVGTARGKEPDASFYLSHVEAVEGKETIDLAVDPPPDLVIEVEISNPLLDGAEVYAALGVPELWRCDGRTLRFFRLDQDGRYVEQPRSVGLAPLESAEAMRWIVQRDSMRHRAWKTAVERWAREELAGRAG